jgi:Uma2 family endonuclease
VSCSAAVVLCDDRGPAYPCLVAYAAPARGCTVEDLDWLRDELGIAHLELDPWGSLIASPATDEHESAVAVLHDQAVRQLGLPAGCMRSNGLAWKAPGGSGYVNVADLTVVAPSWTRTLDLHIDPPPVLVVEVGSPSTRAVDRTRKMADYRLGGAALYLLVDLPGAGSGPEASFEAHDFTTGQTLKATGVIALVVADRPLRFDLPELALPRA